MSSALAAPQPRRPLSIDLFATRFDALLPTFSGALPEDVYPAASPPPTRILMSPIRLLSDPFLDTPNSCTTRKFRPRKVPVPSPARAARRRRCCPHTPCPIRSGLFTEDATPLTERNLRNVRRSSAFFDDSDSSPESVGPVRRRRSSPRTRRPSFERAEEPASPHSPPASLLPLPVFSQWDIDAPPRTPVQLEPSRVRFFDLMPVWSPY